MTQWKRDTRPENVRTFGDFKVFSEVNSDRKTAHVVQLPDGREIRVLPDDRGGHARSKAVRQAVEIAQGVSERLEGDEGRLVLIGALSHYQLHWEELQPDLGVSIEEWMAHWFKITFDDDMPRDAAGLLLRELGDDGWEIVRKGET